MAQMMKRDIGDVLLQGKVISQEQLNQAREIQQRTGADLGKVFEDQGVNPFHILQAKAHLAGMRAVDLTKNNPEMSAITLIPAHTAQRHQVVPITRMKDQTGQEVLVLALADPSNIMAVDDVRMACGLKVQPVLVSPEQIADALTKFYSGTDSGSSNSPAAVEQHTPADLMDIGSINAMVTEYGPVTGGDDSGAPDESDLVQGPIIRIAHAVIQQAVSAGASDIHIEPGARTVRIRYRIDGVLHETMQLPKHIHPPLVSRYKIMSDMNIAERRVPQDGRIGINYQNKDYDLRVSCLPTLLGEKIVMRILDKGSVMIGLNKLGFFPDTMAQLETLFTQPNGMLLVTGPTGSGKSTTLYSVLNRINSIERNIMTVEDPVEYQLPGISQVAVARKAGLTFATALRSFMRQDPDIIMVGEIRDLETAEMAIQASLTGHLVLSTLHTNDAPSSITRLVDMGVEPFLVSATLIGALAQRLGRRICDNCKEQIDVPADSLRRLGYQAKSENEMVPLWQGRGCEKCRNTGYKGRFGIHEMMLVNEEIADLMVRRAPVSEVRNAAKANGMKMLKDDGLRKILAGTTTPEEIARVVFTGGH
ncbi:MAG: type secretion system protein (GspE) [Armatimonadetes bacterium]|nr:type secretion system protein (GspE) [Armatimonadota bacterium]